MLALALGGCTVAELQARMSITEYYRWQEFYHDQPFDDIHRFYRPAALSACVVGGGDFEKMVDVLVNRQRDVGVQDEAALNTFRAFGVEPPPDFIVDDAG